MILVLFFVFACVATASAIMMVVHRNPIYSALFLIVSLFALAGLYVLQNAPFIAAIHVIVYTGAIMVLFLFVLMLLDLKQDETREKTSRPAQLLGWLTAAVLVVELAIFAMSDKYSVAGPSPESAAMGLQIGDTATIGKLLFTKYLFPFEIASILLLSAIIGSVLLAKLKLR